MGRQALGWLGQRKWEVDPWAAGTGGGGPSVPKAGKARRGLPCSGPSEPQEVLQFVSALGLKETFCVC